MCYILSVGQVNYASIFWEILEVWELEYFGRNNYLSEGPRSYRRSGMLTETDVLQVNPEPDQTSSSSAAPEQMDFYWVPR